MADKVEFEVVPKATRQAFDSIKLAMNNAINDPEIYENLSKKLKMVGDRIAAAEKGAAKEAGKLKDYSYAGITKHLLGEKTGGALISGVGKAKAIGGAISGGDIGGALQAGGAAGGPWGAAIAASAALVVKGFTMAYEGVMSLYEATKKYVAVANPAVAERFNKTLQDIDGVIGQSLTPVLEGLISVFRTWGDFLATILPTQEQMIPVLNALNKLADDLRDVFAELVPSASEGMSLAVKMLEKFVNGLRTVIYYMVVAVNSMIEMVNWMRAKIGLSQYDTLALPGQGTGKGRLKGSEGAAHRNAIYSNVEDLSRDLYLKAAGGGTTADLQLEVQRQIERNTRRFEDIDQQKPPGLST